MAEDYEDFDDNADEGNKDTNGPSDKQDDEETVKEKIKTAVRRRHERQRENSPSCRTRIDVLSTPNRRLILDLYQRHAYHLSREKVVKIKELLQELYAMTPEETKKYFLELELENSKKKRRKRLKELLKRQFLKQKREQGTEKAYTIFANILRKGMIYAISHSVPPLVSVRIRNLSDIVLDQLCDLRNVRKPNREDPEKEGRLLIAVADWMAVAMEKVYYNVQLTKNEELERLNKQRNELGNPPKQSALTPQQTKDSDLRGKVKSSQEQKHKEEKHKEGKEEEIKENWTDNFDQDQWEE